MQILDGSHKYGENWIEISPCREFIMRLQLLLCAINLHPASYAFSYKRRLWLLLLSMVNPSFAGRVLLLLFEEKNRMRNRVLKLYAKKRRLFLNAAQILSCFKIIINLFTYHSNSCAILGSMYFFIKSVLKQCNIMTEETFSEGRFVLIFATSWTLVVYCI